MMKAPDSEIDTHFYQGPKSKKQKQPQSTGKEVAEKPKDMTVYISKESGKLIVNDEEEDKEGKGKSGKTKAKKRSLHETKDDYGKESEGDESENEPEVAGKKKVVEEKGAAKAEKVHRPPKKKKAKQAEGHFEVHTGEEYKGKAGKSDSWKKGQKFEPFAYVRFNPKMTNPKRRKMALKNFEKFTKKPKEDEGKILKGVKISSTSKGKAKQ